MAVIPAEHHELLAYFGDWNRSNGGELLHQWAEGAALAEAANVWLPSSSRLVRAMSRRYFDR